MAMPGNANGTGNGQAQCLVIIANAKLPINAKSNVMAMAYRVLYINIIISHIIIK